MDSVSSPELAGIFERVSDYVDLKGATNAWEIDKRMRYTIEKCKTIVKIERASDKPRKSRIETFGYAAEQLDKLVEHDFPARVIYEANIRPRSLIAQTLLFGKEKARQRILAYRRARISEYARAGIRPRIPTPPQVPETRRARAWRR